MTKSYSIRKAITSLHYLYKYTYQKNHMSLCPSGWYKILVWPMDYKSPEELESMLTDIHLVSKPVGLSMNPSKTKVMLNENATTSTVAVDGNTIEKVDRHVYLGKTVTQAGDRLLEIKRRIALGWAAFSKVANIMKSMKASMNVKRKVHNK